MRLPRWLTERDPVWPVLLLAAAVRVHWFGRNRNLWPDEAAYLLMARSFAGLTDYDAPAARPLLLPLIWSAFFRLGFGEFAVRLSVMAFALLGIYWIHRLGREKRARRRIAT